MTELLHSTSFPAFSRQQLAGDADFTVIGAGSLGGKATGLAFIKRTLAEQLSPEDFPGFCVSVPRAIVIATDVFEEFVARNHLYDVALSGAPDDRIAHAFLQADLPPLVVGDLRALSASMHAPVAVRSSGMLEDALGHPFAGIYATKMVPNNLPNVALRFAKLVEAVKLVYASTFFRAARDYVAAIGRTSADERMAVILQEVVGREVNHRYYPTVSGVLRTHNFYPMPPARPEDGVVSLAVGLGKMIVDGGRVWTYSPRFPHHGPPHASTGDLLRNSQTTFWAVNMGPPPPHDPIHEDEYLVLGSVEDAELDGALKFTASTYVAESDRVQLGIGRAGPRVLNFGPLLELPDVPLNDLLTRLATICRAAVGSDVELEFAVTLDPKEGLPAYFGFLQLRPTLVAGDVVTVTEADCAGDAVLAASDAVLGNGIVRGLRDIVYVRPECFEARHTRAVAAEVARINAELVAAGRTCVLIGFGRWGSQDPWLGIPIVWPQVSASRAIIEAAHGDLNVDPSQGSHFFHNLTSFQIPYFTLGRDAVGRINWDLLAGFEPVQTGEFVSHVRAPRELEVHVDGRCGCGVIRLSPSESL